jgi:hypothetical protein
MEIVSITSLCSSVIFRGVEHASTNAERRKHAAFWMTDVAWPSLEREDGK